jgi:hypothetical protein
VLGLDVSPRAIEHATRESSSVDNVSYRVLDASAAGAGRSLAGELGEVNAFMRGVFHVFSPAQRARAVDNLADMMGKRGVVYFAETNYEGDPLDQLVAQGATPTSMPEPLRKLIEAGVSPPRHFGGAQLREIFPADRWETLESGPLTMHGVPLTARAEFEPIPSFYGMMRRRG